MVAWNEYRQEAKARGALAFELFVVESRPAGAPEHVKASLAAHLEYQRDLEVRGILVLAGPVSDPTGEHMQGEGLILYRAKSLAEADEIARADPMHESGARTYRIRKWLVNEGSISINVGLSTGQVRFD